MTQVNTAYPATAYLTGYLRRRGHQVSQSDFSLELFLDLFSRTGVERILEVLKTRAVESPSVQHLQFHQDLIASRIDAVVRFLQGKDPSLALRIITPGFLPEGPRFQALRELDETEGGRAWAFGALGVTDEAKHIASLFIDDIADCIRDGVDSHFGLSRYAEKLAASSHQFTPILEALGAATPSLVESRLDGLTQQGVAKETPDVVGITVPFPGNVYGAFRIAQTIKRVNPHIKTVLGGGYVNTELRNLQTRAAYQDVFRFFDYITYDDGEGPLEAILEQVSASRKPRPLVRTISGPVAPATPWLNSSTSEPSFLESARPSYDGLSIERYVSSLEMVNPMHRLWSDGWWNKLTLAHGCYWKKCAFCDTSLDYISRFEMQSVDGILDRIRFLIKETGQTGFHFVDEAAPPKLLRALSTRILREGLTISWWCNIRFEKTFTSELTELMAQAGCVAVTGGLETASNRLLNLMEKGVTVEQVAQVTAAFAQSGILVHAYLMYGFPSQTAQETVDSLERVRQLFASGCLTSAYWHRFSLTAHSPVGRSPKRYGVTPKKEASEFAVNDLAFTESGACDHDALRPGLEKATYNFMHGMGLTEDVRTWFPRSGKSGKIAIPRTKVSKQWLTRCLDDRSANTVH